MAGAGLREFATGLMADWRAMTADGVQFAYRDDPALIAAALLALALVVLAIRLLLGRRLTHPHAAHVKDLFWQSRIHSSGMWLRTRRPIPTRMTRLIHTWTRSSLTEQILCVIKFLRV